MAWKIILNPYARRNHALKNWVQAEKELRRLGIEYDLEMTEAQGHAIMIAEEAVKKDYSLIVAAGGDGTISEVINGIVKAKPNGGFPIGPLGILPLGTSNDLAFALGIPQKVEAAVNIIAGGNFRTIDICKVNERYFFLNAAIGFEGMGSLYQNKIKYIHGPFRYTLASLLCLLKNPRWHMSINWVNGHYSGEASLVTVGNLSRSGGFYITPHAKFDDGLMTFVYGVPFRRRELIKILPKAKKPMEGNYVEVEGINEHHTKKLTIKLQGTSPLHADGELISTGISEMEFNIVPGGLKVLC